MSHCLSNSQTSFPVSLAELAAGLTSEKPRYVIPPVQRGFVWSATRCEVLWDSILRGIPIGAISLRSNEKDCTWEIFDGQQRATAVAMGYSPWPPEERESILWIDLKPAERHGRQFVFRVTTAAHPWGFELTDDEKNDNRLKVWEQRQAVDSLNGRWERFRIKGARPYPREMWPFKSGLPVPFAVLRAFVENNDTADFSSFAAHCRADFSDGNWFRLLADETTAPESWGEITAAIRALRERSIVAVNASQIAPDDLGLYFKRMNKQGMEPDDEEIRYSLLKSKMPSLKGAFDDNLAKRWPRPALMADIVLRLWLSKEDCWKWRDGVSLADIRQITEDGKRQDGFARFAKDELPTMMERLRNALTGGDAGLLPWHVAQLYRHGGPDSLVVYFLREIHLKRETWDFKALATVVPWFCQDVSRCVKSLWDSASVQDALVKEIRSGNLPRIFTLDELREWSERVKSSLKSGKDWGNGDWTRQEPYIGLAMERIWSGFHGDAGCSLLLYSCRAFMQDYFCGYDAFQPEWRGQNRPWDYDHILPQDWVGDRRVSGYTQLVRRFLWSIGNSAPLPFSLNRGKQANAPDDYPDGDPVSAKRLHVDLSRVNEFGKHRTRYDRLDRDEDASRFFIETTTDRIVALVEEWYTGCEIESVMDFEAVIDRRWDLIENLKSTFSDIFGGREAACGVWFVNGERQYELHKAGDRFRPWLACGVKGTVRQPNGDAVRCVLGIASDGNVVEIGLRRHPDETTIPGEDTWWYGDERGCAYEQIPLHGIAQADLVNGLKENLVNRLKAVHERFGFSPEC